MLSCSEKEAVALIFASPDSGYLYTLATYKRENFSSSTDYKIMICCVLLRIIVDQSGNLHSFEMLGFSDSNFMSLIRK